MDFFQFSIDENQSTLDVVLSRFPNRPTRINMRAIDVGVDAVSNACEEKAVPRGLQRQEDPEGESPPSVGIKALVHADLWSALKRTRARIIKQFKHLPKQLT